MSVRGVVWAHKTDLTKPLCIEAFIYIYMCWWYKKSLKIPQGVIRTRKLKDRQYSDQKKQDKRTNKKRYT